MTDIKIPHAKSVFIDRSKTPYDFLVVVTDLPEHSPSGLEADARHIMMKAIANAKAEHRLQGHRVYWNGGKSR